MTAFPKGADKDNLGSPVVVVRVDPSTLALPADAGVVGARGNPRLLEDLHARGLRDLAVPLAAEPHHAVAAARRSSAPATTRRSTCSTAAASSSVPPDAPLPQLPLQIDASGALAPRRSDVGAGRAVVVGRQPVSRINSPRASDRTVDAVGFVDERLGAARGVRFLLDYVFPDHWSFLLGEIALYSFIVLIATGHLPGAVLRPEHQPDRLPRQLRAAAGPDASRPPTARHCTCPSMSPAAC